MKTEAQLNKNSMAIITGQNTPRIDGPLKVSGQAHYTSDFHFPRLAFAVPVGATVAKGKISSLDTSAAKKMKGVLAVYTRDSIGPLFRSATEEGFGGRIDEARPPFEDDIIRYYGQYVALVVAETLEIAQAGAAAIKVTYSAEKPNLEKSLRQEALKKDDSRRGDAVKAFAGAAHKIDQTYRTPAEVHNPIEMHATVAVWEKGDEGQDTVTLYETSQAIGNHQGVLAQILGVPKESVRVISKFLGSGFGGKLWPWPHSALAASAARKLGRPVKLVIDRSMMFKNVGHRPRTQQQIQLGADAHGKLQSLAHHYSTQASMLEDFKENCGEVSSFLYSVPNVSVSSGVARRNESVPTSMRGPGAVPGLFALESAMDEMAVKLNMDPVQFRLLNDTMIDESTGKPFTSRHLKECLQTGAQKFGWSKRNPKIGSMRDGDEILGWGVSACTWAAKRVDCEASIEFKSNGQVRVNCGTQDIGTGTYTVLANVVHEETGLPLSQIEVVLGDTQLPPGAISGGSMATASIIPPVLEAIRDAGKKMMGSACKIPSSPFFGEKPEDLKFTGGKIQSKKHSAVEFAKLLKQINLNSVTGRGKAKGNFAEKSEKTAKSFGAQFVEIGWNPAIARLRVRRVVSVIDAGRILNPKPAKNQIEGAIVMGVGMGIFERMDLDMRSGWQANSNLADYIVASHADCPQIDVTFLDYPDKEVNELGARGVGEIGLAGIASSICSAVYHATGVRVRELPVRIEDLIS